MKSLMTSIQLSVLLIFIVFVVANVFIATSQHLITSYDNSPAPSDQATRWAMMRECQQRGTWLKLFEKRDVGPDWLDKTTIDRPFKWTIGQ